jgi:hypothetical protein
VLTHPSLLSPYPLGTHRHAGKNGGSSTTAAAAAAAAAAPNIHAAAVSGSSGNRGALIAAGYVFNCLYIYII